MAESTSKRCVEERHESDTLCFVVRCKQVKAYGEGRNILKSESWQFWARGGCGVHIQRPIVTLCLAMARGASGRCKNTKCVNPKTGQRKQAQSGYGGYCATCGAKFAPELVLAARAKQTARKGLCVRCTTALVQFVDESTGEGYCRPCFKDAQRSVLSCFYCTVEGEAVAQFVFDPMMFCVLGIIIESLLSH